jgi:hypothetical protein
MRRGAWIAVVFPLIFEFGGCAGERPPDEPVDEAELQATLALKDAHHAAGPLVFGEVTIDHNWKRVTFARPLKDPVVVVKPFSSNGYQPGVVRLRNVGATGFELRIQEWTYLDGWHYPERVGYLAAERGAHRLDGHLSLVAGSFDTDRIDFARVRFAQAFSTRPVVLTSIATFAGSDPVTGRLRAIDNAGFDYKLQEEEAKPLHHFTERVDYLALAPGSAELAGHHLVVRTATGVDHRFKAIDFAGSSGTPFGSPPVFVAEMQTTDGGNTANLRWRQKTATGLQLQVSEEQSLDAELDHNPETVGYVAIGGQGGGTADFHVVAPLYVQAGEPFTVKVARIDRARGYVRDAAYRGAVTVSATDARAALPPRQTFTAADGGYRALAVTLNSTGLHHLTVTEAASGNRQRSNVIKVLGAAPARQVYFGDIHGHTPFSDGRNVDVDQHYRYARDVALLDLAAVTDHDTLQSCCATTPAEWAHLKQRTTAYHDPGRFVAIPAYEWTDGNPGLVGSGHKNVYYLRATGAEIYSHGDPAYHWADRLWQALEASWSPGEVFTIPHHTARIYRGSDGSSTDWSLHDPRFERLVEIYSVHGLFEHCGTDAFQPPEGKAPGRCVRDALGSYGYRMGFVAASDHHKHPLGYLGPMDGANSFGGLHFGGGLTAVVAPALTRKAIFAAMVQRRTYATSGERILLAFAVDGRPMGSEYGVALPHAPVPRAFPTPTAASVAAASTTCACTSLPGPCTPRRRWPGPARSGSTSTEE